ncbi:MAG: complex I NDUFA9 subunit family protein [Betaproteobacteria bacterium]|nr:complex I NDUFA9 subunit family protein [Betaproteobacteria bacterium]
MAPKTVCVLGGSGFIGRRVVHRLAQMGLDVCVPTRDRERAKENLILLPTADVRTANVHDPAQLEAVLKGMDGVINLVGVLNDFPGGAFQRNHVELPRTLAGLCQRMGISRLVHMSAVNASNTGTSRYLRSKGEGERIVRETKGLAVTVLRPGIVFGEGDRFLNLFAKLAATFPIIPLACAQSRFQPIYVEDVARAVARCLTETETHGKSYDLCGPKIYTLRELVRYTAMQVGTDPAIIGLPRALGWLQAAVMEHLPGRLITRDNLDYMKMDSVSNAPFPEIFGFSPMPLEAVAGQFLGGITSRARYDAFRARR